MSCNTRAVLLCKVCTEVIDCNEHILCVEKIKVDEVTSTPSIMMLYLGACTLKHFLKWIFLGWQNCLRKAGWETWGRRCSGTCDRDCRLLRDHDEIQAVPMSYKGKIHKCQNTRPQGWNPCVLWPVFEDTLIPCESLCLQKEISLYPCTLVRWPHCHCLPQQCLANDLSRGLQGSPCLHRNSASRSLLQASTSCRAPVVTLCASYS